MLSEFGGFLVRVVRRDDIIITIEPIYANLFVSSGYQNATIVILL